MFGKNIFGQELMITFTTQHILCMWPVNFYVLSKRIAGGFQLLVLSVISVSFHYDFQVKTVFKASSLS